MDCTELIEAFLAAKHYAFSPNTRRFQRLRNFGSSHGMRNVYDFPSSTPQAE